MMILLMRLKEQKEEVEGSNLNWKGYIEFLFYCSLKLAMFIH